MGSPAMNGDECASLQYIFTCTLQYIFTYGKSPTLASPWLLGIPDVSDFSKDAVFWLQSHIFVLPNLK